MTEPWRSRFNGLSNVVPTVIAPVARQRRLRAINAAGRCTSIAGLGVRCQRHEGHKGGCRADLSLAEAEAIGLRMAPGGSS